MDTAFTQPRCAADKPAKAHRANLITIIRGGSKAKIARMLREKSGGPAAGFLERTRRGHGCHSRRRLQAL
jgi:hypothetical protein